MGDSSRVVVRKHVRNSGLEDIGVGSVQLELVQFVFDVVMIEPVVLEVVEGLEVLEGGSTEQSEAHRVCLSVGMVIGFEFAKFEALEFFGGCVMRCVPR